MNLASWLIAALIAAVVILDLFYLKKHGLDDCSGNCSSCGTSCKWAGDIEKARKKAARQKKLKAFFHMD